MKTSFAVAALIGSTSARYSAPVPAINQEFVDIVSGVLMGALNAEGFNDIEKCIQDVEHVFTDAKTAIADFEKGDVSSVIDGIKEIADLLKSVQAGMKDCSSLKADWTKLAQMIAVIDSPTSFAYHVGKDLMINGVDIYHEINTAITDYKTQQWYDFGVQIGEATAKTLIGEESQAIIETANKDKVGKFLQGVLTNFEGNFDLYALLMCIYEEDQAALMLDVAVQSFENAWETKDVSEAIGGIIATVAAVTQFKQGLPACEAIDTKTMDFTKFEQSCDIASHPMKYFKVLEKDLLVNGVSIISAIGAGVEAY